MERAAAGPFGTTIAHGYLTLSLAATFAEQLLIVDNVAMAINYGLDRVRFTAPVPSGSRVRAQATLLNAAEKRSGIEATLRLTYEIDGSDATPCVADLVVILKPAD